MCQLVRDIASRELVLVYYDDFSRPWRRSLLLNLTIEVRLVFVLWVVELAR